MVFVASIDSVQVWTVDRSRGGVIANRGKVPDIDCNIALNRKQIRDKTTTRVRGKQEKKADIISVPREGR